VLAKEVPAREEKGWPPKIPSSIFEFAFFADWFGMLNYLEEMAMPENWNFRTPSPERKNQRNPILENYVLHTFGRLAKEYNEARIKPPGIRKSLLTAINAASIPGS